MGCVQSNNAPPTESNQRRKFIDQSGVESKEKGRLGNRQQGGEQLDRVPQWSQQYEYSKHGMQMSQQFKDSRVSIFEQERKKLQQRSNMRLHMEIHPDQIQRNQQQLSQVQQLVRLNEKRRQSKPKPNVLAPLFPVSQQLLLSNILLSNNNNISNSNNNNQQNNYRCEQNLASQQQSYLMSNFQQDFLCDNDKCRQQQQKQQKVLLNSHQSIDGNQKDQYVNNNNNCNRVNRNNINNSETDRELIELRDELNTMIVLWESVIGGGKRLKVEKMNTSRTNKEDTKRTNNRQQTNRSKRQQTKRTSKQFTKVTTKQQQHTNNNKQRIKTYNNKNQQQIITINIKQQVNNTNKKYNTQQQSIAINKQGQRLSVNEVESQSLAISPSRVVDKDLQDIWNGSGGQQINQLLTQKQFLHEQYDGSGQERDECLESGKKPSLANDKVENDLANPRVHIHDDHLPTVTSHQQPIKINLQPIISTNNNNNVINNKSSLKDFSQKQSQPSSHEQYSKCLLSNPTKILNDSLVDQNNQQKEIFYFGNNADSSDQCHYYPKWVETDRKAYQVKNEDIISLQLSNGKQNNNKDQQTINYKSALLPLLCVIKDYKELNRVNLIAFRTMTQTSILLLEPQYNPKLPKQSGFKIFYNGIKRLFPFEQGFDGTDLFTQLERMFVKLYCQLKLEKNSSQLLYNLTGWIPETIMANEISSYEGVFERLNNNFIDGNTIITFTGRNNQVWGLKCISLQKKQIQLYHHTTISNLHKKQQQKNKQSCSQYKAQHYQQQQVQQQFEQTYKWSQFISMVKEINVNWNPLIYQYVWKTQNLFCFNEIVQNWRGKDSISEYDVQYMQSTSHQYLLKIPPSEEDIQVRVFLEVHYCDKKQQSQSHNNKSDLQQQQQSQQDMLVIELHDFTGTRVNSTNSAIRILQKHRRVFSDVLIFQSSPQKTQYMLVIRPQIKSKLLSSKHELNRKQIKYTISALTFVQVALQQIPATRVKQQKVISTYLQESHCGYGINSPHFLNNFYLQLKIPPLERLKIFVVMPVKECMFELNLIANPDGEENLTRLNLENILGDIVTSEQFQSGKGYLEIDTKYEEYFFMITNHTMCKGEFKIVMQVLENVPKYLTSTRLQSIHQHILKSDQQQQLQHPPSSTLIQSKQRFFYQQPIFIKEFKWLPTHTGPRKRLKSNTHSGYQAFVAFREFFKNPFIDYKIDKFMNKRFQFSVHCKSFMEEFDSLQQEELKNEVQPPTISMVILKVKRPNQITPSSQKNIPNQSSFKIILDDAFYVPFGFGFWTKIMQLEEGQYRFVFPKMEKQFGIGLFSVYQMEKE